MASINFCDGGAAAAGDQSEELIKLQDDGPSDSSQGSWTSSNDLALQLKDNQLTRMTEAQEMAMFLALNNPLVVQNIINRLESLPDLTSCRLVDHLWYSLTTEILRHRDLTLVTIVYDPSLKIFRRSSQYSLANENFEKVAQNSDLKELNDLLVTQHANFPCSHFIFKTFPLAGDLGEGDVQKFFRIHGQKIKTLELYNEIIPCCPHFEAMTPPMTSRQTFVQILNECAPNVSKLSIQYFDYDWPESFNCTGQEPIIKGPNLTEFSWRGKERLCCPGELPNRQQFYDYSNPNQTAHQILQGAPNLRQIHNFRLIDLDLVIKSGKVFAIKNLDLRSGQRLLFLPADLNKFVDAGGQLTNLHCVLPNYRIRNSPEEMELMEAYEKLIESSKDTLSILHFGSLKFSKEVAAADGPNQFPGYSFTLPRVMPKIKELRLGSAVYRSGRCLPVTIDSNTFPNLETLDCTILGFYEARDAREAAAAFRAKRVEWAAAAAAGILPHVRTLAPVQVKKCPSKWDDYFPKSLDGQIDGFQNDLPSVQTLIIGAHCGVDYMKKLYCLCPNFKNVVIQCPTVYHDAVANTMALWPHLETVKIVLTGGHLFQSQAQNLYHLFAEGVNSLFLGMQKLKRLEICFKGPSAKAFSHGFQMRLTGPSPPISELGALNSFNLMPKLKVVLKYDHNCQYSEGLTCMLQSIASYVNLVHEHDANNEPIGQ